MAYNVAHAEIKTLDGAVLNLTEDFKYLGSHIGSSEKDIQIRKAWRALHSMKKVWRSSMHVELKKKLFVTTVEAICALILSENLALYKLFTYLLTYYTSVWL